VRHRAAVRLFDWCSSRSTLFNSVHTGWSWPLFLHCSIELGDHIEWCSRLPLLWRIPSCPRRSSYRSRKFSFLPLLYPIQSS
jgi:hypothetical protein